MNERIQQDQLQDMVRRQRCNTLVIALVGKQLAQQWWTSPNKRFNGATPETTYQVAPDGVYQYLMSSAEGEW